MGLSVIAPTSTTKITIFADVRSQSPDHPAEPIIDVLKNITRHLAGFLAIGISCFVTSAAQPANFIRLPRLNLAPNGYDTVGHKNALRIAEETQNIIEKAVDPASYLLGPNDMLTVAITGPQPLSVDVAVSPDLKVLVPAVPAIDVRGCTLLEGQKKIATAVKNVYRSQSVDVLLKKIKLFKVSVYGAVRKPIVVSASSSDRVSEVIDRAGGLMFNASTRRITIDREGGEKIAVDLLRFFTDGLESANPYVYCGDKISIPYITDEECVTVKGSVKQEGAYEFLPGDSLFNHLAFAQGLTVVGMADSIEVSRYEESGLRIFSIIIDTRTGRGNIPMRLGDKVYVRERTGVYRKSEVAVAGGVAHPGSYSINPKTDRLSDLITRAGGYTEDAQPETGLLFRRKDFTWYDRELDRLSKMKPENMNEYETRYYRTKSSENMGLVSVDFEKIFASEDPDSNPLLVHLDSVYVPRSTNYVTLIGRVGKPGRVPFKGTSTYLDYIRSAGGFGLRADEEEVLIQKVSGELHRAIDYSSRLDPGDNILVPERSDVRFIDVFTKALAITAQLATIVGVVIGVVFAYRK
ncbi:MAG: SLBB domain-containing protein [Candidatus Kapaibacterium sp.]